MASTPRIDTISRHTRFKNDHKEHHFQRNRHEHLHDRVKAAPIGATISAFRPMIICFPFRPILTPR